MKITHNKVGQNVNLVDGAKQEKPGAARGAKDATAASALGSPAGPSASNNAKPAEAASKVDVSDRAQQAKRIKDLAMSAPDVDSAKVERLRNLIDAGQYKVDARAVADRMVDEHLEDDMMEAKN